MATHGPRLLPKIEGPNILRECPCGGFIETLDTRLRGTATARRRVCRGCGERFTTYEITAARFEELLAAERDLRSMRSRIAEFVARGESTEGR